MTGIVIKNYFWMVIHGPTDIFEEWRNRIEIIIFDPKGLIITTIDEDVEGIHFKYKVDCDGYKSLYTNTKPKLFVVGAK
jgi:hypothetical protein